jgi:Arc/MetJ family transcription regulator
MRTTVDLDEDLINEAAKFTGAKTKKDAITATLVAYIKKKKWEELATIIGHDDQCMTLKEFQKSRNEN